MYDVKQGNTKPGYDSLVLRPMRDGIWPECEGEDVSCSAKWTEGY